jgi:hypothetical protein
MMKKSFYGLVVCLSMFAVVLCSGVASAAPGDPCTTNDDCIDTVFCNGVESCSLEGSATVCVAGTNPCSAPTPACIEEGTGTCVECVLDGDCAEGEACEENLCVEAACPSDTPEKVLLFDEDGDCLLNKEELKKYSDSLKTIQKQQKTDLKNQQSADKAEYNLIKTNYSN